MEHVHFSKLERYLSYCLGGPIKVSKTGEIGLLHGQGAKEFGYGKVMEITYEKDGKEKQVVLSTMKGDRYGHQFYWDRAAILMFEYETGTRMEKHVRPLGLGYIGTHGQIVPTNDIKEFFILNEKIEGDPYFLHLERIQNYGLEEDDIQLVENFADWLSRIHFQKFCDPDIYMRRIRQLLGDSECIWGIADGYPFSYEHFPPERFQRLEKKLIDWRWKLKNYFHRLSITHGDFHPWNVLINHCGDFHVLDRSRGEWGEPADDLAAMTCNYFLYGINRGNWHGSDFEKLYLRFWERYLEKTSDEQILEVIAPFYVFRALVLASPEWYPHHSEEVRKELLNFAESVAFEDRFDYRNIGKYAGLLEAPRK